MLNKEEIKHSRPIQKCPECGNYISAVGGSKEAICHNCGFKDSCCF